MIHVPSPRPITRREALCKMGAGFGMLSFASLVGESLAQAAEGPAPWMIQDPHFKPKAKHVIFLFMNGGLSQVDSFDPKPVLDKFDGQPLPGETPQHERKTGGLMKSPFTFKKYGKSGIEVSELFPHVGECIDDICVIRSMHTEIPNHEPALIMMNTGANVSGRPSMGSWLTYGLGTENKNLPSFVVLCPDVPTTVGPPLWNSAFLPPMYQGTYVTDDAKSKEFDPQKLIPDIHNEIFDLTRQKKELDLIAQLDRLNMGPGAVHDQQLDATIAALIKDLKARGLFDETLIVCGSEFGRTPVVEMGSGFMGGQTHNGRDHNPHGFTMWLAGGGVKGGMTYGATDDFGWKVVDKPVHVHDLHATILYLLGIDHTKLTYRYSGRDFRLTDVAGNVIHDIIA